MANNYTCRWTSKNLCSRCRRELITTDMIPDDIPLQIFDRYVHQDAYGDVHMDDDGALDYDLLEKQSIEGWQTLTHTVDDGEASFFNHHNRLNLRPLCARGTPVRDRMDVWPALPLIVHDFGFPTSGLDGIIAALARSDRVCQIDFEFLTSSQMEDITSSSAMQIPFPELT